MLVDRHPAGGFVELVFDGDFIVLRCRWPLDLSEDDWIDIHNRYHVSNYQRAVDNAMANGTGKAPGVDGGFLEIGSVKDGFTIEFSRPQTGWSAGSLQLHVRRPLDELLLRSPVYPPSLRIVWEVASGLWTRFQFLKSASVVRLEGLADNGSAMLSGGSRCCTSNLVVAPAIPASTVIHSIRRSIIPEPRSLVRRSRMAI